MQPAKKQCKKQRKEEEKKKRAENEERQRCGSRSGGGYCLAGGGWGCGVGGRQQSTNQLKGRWEMRCKDELWGVARIWREARVCSRAVRGWGGRRGLTEVSRRLCEDEVEGEDWDLSLVSEDEGKARTEVSRGLCEDEGEARTEVPCALCEDKREARTEVSHGRKQGCAREDARKKRRREKHTRLLGNCAREAREARTEAHSCGLREIFVGEKVFFCCLHRLIRRWIWPSDISRTTSLILKSLV